MMPATSSSEPGRPLRLCLAISSLQRGGAEGIMACLANGLAGRGHEITLLTLDRGEEPPAYELAPSIRHQPLGLSGPSATPLHGLAAIMRRIRRLRRAILDATPDLVVSFMDQTNVLVLLAVGSRLPVLASERIHPAFQPLSAPWRALRRLTYPRAAAIIVQSESIRDHFSATIRRRCRVIPNPVLPPPAEEPLETAPPRPRIVAAGRLVPQKGVDLLLHAFAGLAAGHPDWSMDIYGQGPQRDELESLRDRLGLGERVRLPGFTSRLGAHLRQADIMVLPSRFEGFPNVLCEALARGVPAVAADCPCGPADIMVPEENGLLVPPEDAPALARALDRLINDPALRRRLAANAPDVLRRFPLKGFLDSWEALFQKTTPMPGHGRRP